MFKYRYGHTTTQFTDVSSGCRIEHKYLQKHKKKYLVRPRLQFGDFVGNPVSIDFSDFSGHTQHFEGTVWILEVHNTNLLLGKYLKMSHIPWPHKLNTIKLSQRASSCIINMKEFVDGRDSGKNFQLSWLGINEPPTTCTHYPSDLKDRAEFSIYLPLCYKASVHYTSTDRVDIPIGQSNRVPIFFSFPEQKNLLVLAKNGTTITTLPFLSIPIDSFNIRNFLLTITSDNGQYEWKNGISFSVKSWNDITLNPATIDIA